MARRVQVAILSDSRLFQEAFSSRLALEDEIEVVGADPTLRSLVRRTRGHPIDVLLVYASIRSAAAAQIVLDVKTLLPGTRVVVVGCEQGTTDPAGRIQADAMAWLEHGGSYESVVETIHAVCEGRTGISYPVAQRRKEVDTCPRLTVSASTPSPR